ncbi:MAG: hypothetical protein QOC80_575, partial [Frankiaceae bacterium]|nr:hypothetical protein [Frankiaceae bacterium]
MVYLDTGDDLTLVAAAAEWWYAEAREVLGATREPKLFAIEQDEHEATFELRPPSWQAALNDRLYLLRATWGRGVAPEGFRDVVMGIHRFGEGRKHAMLKVIARPSSLDDPSGGVNRLAGLARRVDEVCDPAYGEVVVNSGGRQPNTCLDLALRRSRTVSADEGRRWLRGYEWITLCPRELVDQLGGVEALRASGAFTRVTPSPQGG